MAREVRFGVRLTGDSQGAVNAMHMTDRELRRLGRQIERKDRTIRRSRREWDVWAQSMGGVRRILGPLAGIGGVSLLRRTASNVIEQTAAISEAADVGGVTAETYQELTKAFEDLGGIAEGVTSGALRRFNRRLGLADQGTGAAAGTFEDLEIAIRDVDGQMRSTDDVLRESLRTLADIESGSERAARASQMFGEDAGPRLAAVLGQGSDALDEQIDALREQGRVLDNETVANARAANDQLSQMRDIISSRFNQQILDNADSYMQLADALATAAEKGLDFLSVTSDLTKWAAEGAAARTGGIAEDDIARLEQESDRIETMLNLEGIAGMGQRLRFFGRDGLVQYYSRDELEQELEEIDRAIQRHYERQEQRGTRDQGPRIEPLDIPTGRSAPEPQPIPEPESDDAGSAPSGESGPGWLSREMERQVALIREQTEAYRELEQEGSRVYEETRTPLEELNQEMARLDHMLDAGVISWDTYARATLDAQESMDDFADRNEEASSAAEEFWTEAARNMQRSMSDFFFDAMQGEMDDLVGNFKATIDRMVADLLASQLLETIGGAMSEQGGFIGAIGGAMESFDGGGYTGPGPRSGGVDGKGGFPAILHPNETVTDHTRERRGGQGGGITVNMNIQAQDADSFRRSESQVMARTQAAMARASRKNL
ncbi:hypothetical protein [Thioalkalivibrio sp. ALJ24]|uniref:hypothetical protein n=1 Tax=Thioalkalivibrio sp. ALJ24 TaxID=545276 RepID=UPI000365A0B8|nr:hypothetical protein [Thioalkalivibrio sp. ALJ24]